MSNSTNKRSKIMFLEAIHSIGNSRSVAEDKHGADENEKKIAVAFMFHP